MNLDQLIREYIIEKGEDSENKYWRYLQLGKSSLRELDMDVSGVRSTAYLEVSDNDTAPLPSNYINYYRIAACDRQGNLQSLAFNPNMCLNHTFDDCGNPIKSQEQEGIQEFFGFPTYQTYTNSFVNGEFVGKFFGIGGGNSIYGTFRIDKANNVIQFGGLRTTHLVLEYLANMNDIDENFEIHPYIYECLKNRIDWRLKAFDTKISLGEKQLSEQIYWKSHILAKKRYSSDRLKDWYDAVRKNNVATYKF